MSSGAKKFRATLKLLAAQNKLKCISKDKKRLIEEEGGEEKSFLHIFCIIWPFPWNIFHIMSFGYGE